MSTKSAGKRNKVDGSKLRSLLISTIHLVRQQLDMTDEHFREYLRSRYNVESLAQLPQSTLRWALETLLRRLRLREQTKLGLKAESQLRRLWNQEQKDAEEPAS